MREDSASYFAGTDAIRSLRWQIPHSCPGAPLSLTNRFRLECLAHPVQIERASMSGSGTDAIDPAFAFEGAVCDTLAFFTFARFLRIVFFFAAMLSLQPH